MFPDLRFMLAYVFPAVVVVWLAPIEFWPSILACATAHLHTTTHLIVLSLFPYAQIIRIYYATLVSYCDMYFLLWLLCDRRLSRRKESLAAPITSSAHLLTTTHLVVSLLLPHKQFTLVYPLTFASCSDMHLLSWLLCGCRLCEEEGELAAPVR
jgi:hypothetical protein